MNVLGELSILAYFLYLTIKPSPELQTHYKIIIIMMVVIFIITYLLAVLNVLYVALWHIYKSRKHRVVNVDEEYPIYNQETKSKAKDDSKKPGKMVDDAIPTWRYTPDSARTSTLTH